MKKAVVFIMILILALMFSGCNAEKPETDLPEISAPLNDAEITEPSESLPWERDPEKHWKTNENGEKLEEGEHDFDDLGICSFCRCEVTENNGAPVIYVPDSHGNYVCKTFYNSDGKIYDEIISEFEYDENKNKIFEKTYPNPEYRNDGEIFPTESFTAEFEYEKDSSGLYYISKIKTVYADGSSVLEEYIDSRNVSSTLYFDADGTMETELLYEYSLDENGNKYLSERTEHDCIYGGKYFYGYDAKGNLLYLEEVDPDGETVRRDEFKYND
ncbi:MAG: hypothetical protein IJ283_03055 [Oscillospiraceae bacterium]|nr:hypothetical protein [Oscillospiraceae bacterium]